MKLLVAVISLILIATQPIQSMAQVSATSAEDVARLSDEEVRRLLLERLLADDAGGGVNTTFNPAFTAHALQQELGLAQRRAGEIAASFPNMLRLPGKAWSQMMQDRTAGNFGLFLFVFILSLTAALAADRMLAKRLAQFLPDLPPPEHSPVGSHASAACSGLLFEAARLAAFTAVATAVFFLLGADEQRGRTVFIFYLSAAVIVKAATALARIFMAPEHPGARIPAFDDDEAWALYSAILRTTAFGAFGFYMRPDRLLRPVR